MYDPFQSEEFYRPLSGAAMVTSERRFRAPFSVICACKRMPATKEALEAIAKEERRTVSQVAAMMIEEGLERRKKGKAKS